MENIKTYYEMTVRQDATGDQWNEKLTGWFKYPVPITTDTEAVNYAKRVIQRFNSNLSEGVSGFSLVRVQRVEAKVKTTDLIEYIH